MKLVFIFYDPEDGALVLSPTVIRKHSANITQQDIENEVSAMRKEKGGLFHYYKYIGAIEGKAKKFEPVPSFKL